MDVLKPISYDELREAFAGINSNMDVLKQAKFFIQISTYKD